MNSDKVTKKKSDKVEWAGCDKLAELMCDYPHCVCNAMADGPTPPPNGGTPPVEGTYTIQEFREDLVLYLEEFTDGVDELEDLLQNDDLQRARAIEDWYELDNYDQITRKAFLWDAVSFVKFAAKRVHIEPITNNQ